MIKLTEWEGVVLKRILLVEDDRALSNGILMALKNSGIEIKQCFDLISAKSSLSENTFDLIILDINLPDGNGLDLLQGQQKSNSSSIILLSANDMETDIVTGLEMGADDYITKPFSLAILRARVNAQFRKQTYIKTREFKQDNFLFDFDKMEFYKSSVNIELSKTEQKLLQILIKNKGLTLERKMLVDRIWTSGAEYVDENALSVTIKRLRDKLENNPAKPIYIKTIYGIGYTWVVKACE